MPPLQERELPSEASVLPLSEAQAAVTVGHGVASAAVQYCTVSRRECTQEPPPSCKDRMSAPTAVHHRAWASFNPAAKWEMCGCPVGKVCCLCYWRQCTARGPWDSIKLRHRSTSCPAVGSARAGTFIPAMCWGNAEKAAAGRTLHQPCLIFSESPPITLISCSMYPSQDRKLRSRSAGIFSGRAVSMMRFGWIHGFWISSVAGVSSEAKQSAYCHDLQGAPLCIAQCA